MPKDYPPEQLWPLYEKLPGDLKEAIFSEKTADSIHEICTRNGLEEEKISRVAKYTGYVLLGVLPLEDFEKTLKEEIKLKNDLSKKIAWEISRFIFSPLRASLEQIYKTEITPPLARPLEEGIKERPKKDIYREIIE